jgi:dTMP kinase
MFFCFDGIDGAGKTTQIKLFADWLTAQEREFVVFRDPGGTPLSERIRDLLLSRSNIPIGIRAEMLLYMAARTQLVQEGILPAIEAGKIVITDRYTLATVAYQGYGGGLPVDQIRAVAAVATQNCSPDRTFLLDLDPIRGRDRRNLEPDRIEARGDDYLLRVRNGFLAEARLDPRISVIDAARPIQEVQQAVRQIATPMLHSGHRGTP